MPKTSFKNYSPKDIYAVFFNAIKQKDGAITRLSVYGTKKPIFILKNNPFKEKIVIDLDSYDIYRLRTFLGRIISIDNVLDIDDTNNQRHRDLFEDEIEKIMDLISDDLKSKAIEKLKKKAELKAKQELKKTEIKKIKAKYKRPIVRRSFAK
jgi:hypothetical protein